MGDFICANVHARLAISYQSVVATGQLQLQLLSANKLNDVDTKRVGTVPNHGPRSSIRYQPSNPVSKPRSERLARRTRRVELGRRRLRSTGVPSLHCVEFAIRCRPGTQREAAHLASKAIPCRSAPGKTHILAFADFYRFHRFRRITHFPRIRPKSLQNKAF